MKTTRIRSAVLVSLLLTGLAAQAATATTFKDLGAISAQFMPGFGEAKALNEAGVAVGESREFGPLAVYSQDGTFTPINQLSQSGYRFSGAYDINNQGLVVGWASTSGAVQQINVGYVFDTQAQQTRFLPSFPRIASPTPSRVPVPAYATRPWSINDSGSITGNADIDDYGSGHVFRLNTNDTQLTDLHQLTGMGSGSSNGVAINQSNTVAGTYKEGTQRAFIISSAGTLQWIDVAGATATEAVDLNDAGTFLGRYTDANNGTHSFIADITGTRDIGSLGGDYTFANGMNEWGQVVGVSRLSNGEDHAFFYDGQRMLDLSDQLAGSMLGWTSLQAKAINGNGQILMTGVFNDARHAVLITASIPEPATAPLMLLGLAGLGLLTGRRRA